MVDSMLGFLYSEGRSREFGILVEKLIIGIVLLANEVHPGFCFWDVLLILGTDCLEIVQVD